MPRSRRAGSHSVLNSEPPSTLMALTVKGMRALMVSRKAVAVRAVAAPRTCMTSQRETVSGAV